MTSIGVACRFSLSQWLYRVTSRPLTKPLLSDRFVAKFQRVIAPDLARLAEITGVRLPLRAT